MADNSPSSDRLPAGGRDTALAAEIADGLAPVLSDLTAEFSELVDRRLAAEGWQDAQRADIAARAASRFMAGVLEGEVPAVAIETALQEARRAFMADLFDSLREDGSNRETAFLTLVMLDRENEERAGAAHADYPLQWLEAAVGAVEQAADDGAGSAEQIARGFSALAEAARAQGWLPES